MLRERRVIISFFVCHLMMVIPILLVSMLLTFVLSRRIITIENAVIDRQLEVAGNELIQEFLRYDEEGILMANMPELLPYNMLNDYIAVAHGIELLELKCNLDSNVAIVFATYGTDAVYSSRGVSSKNVFFKNGLGCDNKSSKNAIEAIENPENVISFLYTTQDDGFLLYSMNSNRKGENSTKINFLIPFRNVLNMFSTKYENQYYELTAQDGSRLFFLCNGENNIKVIGKNAWENIEDIDYMISREFFSSEMGLQIKLNYDEKELFVNQWLLKIQSYNWLLIIMGGVFSAIISLGYSRKRSNELVFLENTTRGEFEQLLPEKSIYAKLQKSILMNFQKKQELEKGVFEHKNRMHEKITSMIFDGVYKDIDKLDMAFQEIGFQGYPHKYFVGSLSGDNLLNMQMPLELMDCLKIYVDNNENTLLIFLCELKYADEDQMQRKQLAGSIREQLHQQGIRKVRIGMSQVINDPLLIDHACKEAKQALQDVLSGADKDYFKCFDYSNLQQLGIVFEEKLLMRFEDALYERNLDEAIESFKKMIYASETKRCSEKNKIYIRYEILQCLIQFLKKEDFHEKTVYIRECLNIDMTRERDFVRTVTNILNKCLPRRKDESFIKMIEFINSNFQNGGLSGDEVAEVGGISKNYLSRIFRSKLNMSYIEYLTMVRMDKACVLLRTTDKKIQEIANLVGYENAVTFRRAFHDQFNMNASEYRKRERIYQEDENENN